MPKTLEVLTCGECKYNDWCWREGYLTDATDPRDGVGDTDNWYCGSARPKEAQE